MKITFTKLNTKSSNLTVKYDEEGNNIVNYPVNKIKQNNNKIEFDSSLCADLDAIEISTSAGSIIKPNFNENNDYDTLFEYLNGCKTSKWVIDQEHFPYTWKKLFGPEHVVNSYKFQPYLNGENIIGHPEYFNFNRVSNFIGSYELSTAQKYLEDFPMAYDGKIYVWDNGEYSEYDPEASSDNGEYSEYDPETRVYLKTVYSYSNSLSDQVLVLHDIFLDGKAYKIVECNGSYYIVAVDNKGEANLNIGIRLQSCSSDVAEFYALPQAYSFEPVEPGSGHYAIYNYGYDRITYFRHSYNSSVEDNNYDLVLTEEYVEGTFDFPSSFLCDELNSFFNNPENSFNNRGVPAYKVYVDGYDLMDDSNIGLSKRLYNMLTAIQYNWRGYFPLISYSSFNDRTFEEYGDSYGYNTPYLLSNCNSIIKLLGQRRICNWKTNMGDNPNYYLNKLSDIEDEYFSSSAHIYVYERNIEEDSYLASYAYYYIIPSVKRSSFTRRLQGGTAYIQFFKGINAPKNMYSLSSEASLQNIPPEDKDFFNYHI